MPPPTNDNCFSQCLVEDWNEKDFRRSELDAYILSLDAISFKSIPAPSQICLIKIIWIEVVGLAAEIVGDQECHLVGRLVRDMERKFLAKTIPDTEHHNFLAALARIATSTKMASDLSRLWPATGFRLSKHCTDVRAGISDCVAIAQALEQGHPAWARNAMGSHFAKLVFTISL